MLTLGINYSQMHDSSACLVRDGKLLFAVAEERICRALAAARPAPVLRFTESGLSRMNCANAGGLPTSVAR